MDSPSSRRPLIVFSVVGVIAVGIIYALIKGAHTVLPLGEPEPQIVVSSTTVKDNDNLAIVLKRVGMGNPDVFGIERALLTAFKQKPLYAGESFELISSTDGIFKKLVYTRSPLLAYVITPLADRKYDVQASTKATVWIEKRLTLEVKNFLYKDLLDQGFKEGFVANMVAKLGDELFSSRVDFFTEQRPGDKLDVLYEQNYIVGQDTPLNGSDHLRIIYASYMGKGTRSKENYAFRFVIPNPDPKKQTAGYFDEKGQAARSLFLRVPFTHGNFRLSSRFSQSRFHPILRVYRPHHGIDYAAAYGTAVSAIGAGKVIYAGWKGGFGKCVEIKHNGSYVSRYGHLSTIAVRPGQGVGQGQYVGRVGNSGLSTGPHLHFEMLVNGNKTNFLSMKFPPSAPLPSEYVDDFKKAREALLSRLESVKPNS
jgi:murein DD-endopeptidase MepM/ murein hydrolase activator NlpD